MQSLPQNKWIRAGLVWATVGFGAYVIAGQIKENRIYRLSARNFYGVLRVRDDPPANGLNAMRFLIHGTINHGSEMIGRNGGRTATSYFGPNSGISRAIQAKGASGPIRIGVLGLGAGVTASLARPGDTLHYYEINPLIYQIATSWFSFYTDCPADKHLYLGDGRLVLERLPSEQLDLLSVDAFSSDSVPIHLLTREAYQVYLRHLKPDGAIAVNVSNRYLNLVPIVANAMSELGWKGVIVSDDTPEEGFYNSSSWIIISPSTKFFQSPSFADYTVEALAVEPGFRTWTDDFSNILQILK